MASEGVRVEEGAFGGLEVFVPIEECCEVHRQGDRAAVSIPKSWRAALLDALLRERGLQKVWIDPTDHEDLQYTIACRGYTRPEPGHVPIYVPLQREEPE